ncbi:sensor histidine kinase [Actinomadura alba]|uniref:sensor histidine kinase n=1 Tax=Actinomadura alba TaxID=406431 RepID=UPI0028A8B8A1|nr:sensor histidine kinase [Actinomadura alba]
MNGSEKIRTGPWAHLPRAARDAAVHGPKEPPRTLLWPARPGLARILVVVVCFALAIGFTGGSIAIHAHVLDVPTSQAWLLGLAQCLPLLIAARWPLIAWRVTAAGLLCGVIVMATKDEFWPWPVTSFLSLVFVLFAVAVSYERRTSGGAVLLTIVGVIAPAALLAGMPVWFGIILTGIVLIVLAFGDAVGGRYAAEASLAEHAELHRQDLARHAVLEERARIARELHDVVAHHMSVIAMQAEAAPYKIPELPDAAKDTFVVVRDAAREALAETRRVVGLLRADDEAAERRPQPGLDRLDELTRGATQSGLAVRVRVVGVPRPVAAGVDLSAYRIVQESLSNASRYAPGARVDVEVRYGPDLLRVRVVDDGARTTPQESGGGHGLIGMHERVAMLGGTLSAGPDPGNGWSVVAELPYGDPP